MIEVQIGSIKKIVEEVNPIWINEQLVRRRRDGEPVCVQVFVDKPPIHMRLSTPDCPSQVGGRPATPQENEIFELWERYRMNDSKFTGGNLVAFLRQVSR